MSTAPLYMSRHEIIYSYEHAKHKAKMIGVLADLNAVSKERIKDILIAEGVLQPKEKKK